MRTPEQIANLRRVLIRIVGPLAIIAPDDMIDRWANLLQDKIDMGTIKHTWQIRLRTMDDPEKPWEEIEPEPKHPCATVESMHYSFDPIFEKYKNLWQVQLIPLEGGTETWIITRAPG